MRPLHWVGLALVAITPYLATACGFLAAFGIYRISKNDHERVTTESATSTAAPSSEFIRRRPRLPGAPSARPNIPVR